MEDQNMKEAETMEEEARYHIIHVDDEHDNEEKRKILDEFTEEVTVLFADIKAWLKENHDPDKVAAYKEKVKLETALLIQKVKVAVAEVNENDKVKSGKETVKAASKHIGNKISSGVQDVIQHENVQKVMNDVSTKVHQVKEDERVKETVKKVKRGTLHIASSAYDSLKKVLEEHEEEPEVIEVKTDIYPDDKNKPEE